MANKISVILEKIETRLKELVDGRVLKEVGRKLIEPMTAKVTPVLAFVPGTLRRASDKTYTTDVVLQLVCRSGSKVELETIDTIAAIDEVIDALAVGGTVTGLIDQPSWDFWTVITNEGLYQPVGAIGHLTISVNAPLKA